MKLPTRVAITILAAAICFHSHAPSFAQGGIGISPDVRKFTLACAAMGSSTPTFFIDINLDEKTYYRDSLLSQLDEVGEVDSHKIILRRHFAFEYTFGFSEQVFSRDDGFFYFGHDDLRDAKPSATCTVEPPRDGFKANVKYRPPGRP